MNEFNFTEKIMYKGKEYDVDITSKTSEPILCAIGSSFATKQMTTKRGERFYQKLKTRIDTYVVACTYNSFSGVIEYIVNSIYLKLIYDFYPENTFPESTNLFYFLNSSYYTVEKTEEDKFDELYSGDILSEHRKIRDENGFLVNVKNLIDEKDSDSFIKMYLQEFLFTDSAILPYESVSAMIEHQLKLSSLKSLGYLSVSKEAFNEDNFVSLVDFIPEIELVRIINDTVINCSAIVTESFKHVLFDISVADQTNKTLANKDKQINKWKTETLELRKKVKKQEKIIATMEKEAASSKDEIYEDLVDKNTELARRELKLKKKYGDLLSKYNDLKSKIGDCSADDSNYSTQGFKELDVNGKYLFVADEGRTNIVNNIIETFPNSTVSQDNFNLTAEAVDMVVVLSSLIDHPTYHNIKNQCKVKNIPLIHCSNTNIDIIKSYMTAEINKGE